MRATSTWRRFPLIALAASLLACEDGDSTSPHADTGPVHARDAEIDAAGPVAPSDAGSAFDAGTLDAGRDARAMDATAYVDSTMTFDATVVPDASPSPGAGHDSATTPVNDEDAGPADAGPPMSEDTFSMRVVASGLDAPWEITWGPDARLWITERAGWRVLRMNPATGSYFIALEVSDVYQASGQDGVLGMALHPQLGLDSGSDYVYLAYTYDADPSAALERRAKLVRFTFDWELGTLGSPVSLVAGLPASDDHNSGRLIYGPDDHLYHTIGDQGHNQFDNKCSPVRAQDLPTQYEVDHHDWSTYQGKILRIGLDGSIPADNPTLSGVRSHIFSFGHRNAQGLAFGPTGKLYASEHGPKTDDEINLIVSGKNYGWPHVAGYRDNQAYFYANWSGSAPESCESLSYSDYDVPDAVPKDAETAWSHPDYVAPLRTLYTVDNSFDFLNLPCEDNDFICWPTVAPSSLDLYVPGNNGLQSWGAALLVPNLKHGSVLRLKLSASGESVEGETTELFKTTNRYRDLAIAPDNRTFYVITDSSGATSGPTSHSTQELEHPGAVLEFTYTAQP